MKCFSFLSLMILMYSCSRFSIPHYRHVKKVPAFVSSIPDTTEHPQAKSMQHDDRVRIIQPTLSDAETQVIEVTCDSICNDVFENNINISTLAPSVEVTHVFKNHDSPVKSLASNTRRDWSVLVALVFIFCGFLLLIWSIAIFFALPAAFWIRLLIAIGMFPLAVKLILRGAGILMARIRRPADYKESGN